MRITGMATGMDTDTMIKDMLKPQQLKIDSMKQQQQIVLWQQEIYRDIIKDVHGLMGKYFDVLNKDTYLLSSESLNSSKVKCSNEILNISANSEAKEGTYKVNVEQLATNASFKGGKADVDTSTEIGENKTFEFQINGSTETIKVEATADMKIGDLAKAISEKSNGEIKLEYSEITESFELSTSKTGVNSNLKVISGGEFLKDKLKLNVLADDGTENIAKGENPSCKITLPNGQSGYIKSETNKFSKDGINFDLNGINTDLNGKVSSEDGDFTITITKDNGKAMETVKSFIEDYNKLIDKVNKLNTEKRNYSYKPLTDDEKKDMKEEEIKKWEEQAKKGILKGDSYLKNMMSELRMDMFGDKDTLFSIGIETSDNVREGGKLVLDEDKFKKALNEDSEKTFNTFKIGMEKVDTTFKKYASTRILGDTGNRGLLLEKAGIEGSVTDKNNILTKSILDKEDMIKEQVKKMNEMENRYYLQFAQLEKAMNSLNSQMNWFTQQMGS
ncbi:flagellar filament capping protein FliD [Clostridium senegalense]|uniref:flagellar filament capping protein FliD n=1 Tax=Clostridium senegalense TaxID=1465809 RepID=UPI001C1110A2|nr:flagellar filament capping protein FliD [Clostridium senegalense]MBU5225392.1 flagellar filament capping protein FliD [Clostridium senegalense]